MTLFRLLPASREQPLPESTWGVRWAFGRRGLEGLGLGFFPEQLKVDGAVLDNQSRSRQLVPFNSHVFADAWRVEPFLSCRGRSLQPLRDALGLESRRLFHWRFERIDGVALDELRPELGERFGLVEEVGAGNLTVDR